MVAIRLTGVGGEEVLVESAAFAFCQTQPTGTYRENGFFRQFFLGELPQFIPDGQTTTILHTTGGIISVKDTPAEINQRLRGVRADGPAGPGLQNP